MVNVGGGRAHGVGPPDERRAYVGRTPDGAAFFGYVTDAATERSPLEKGGPWVEVERALAWARARAGELNKGGDAARAALAMLRIKRRLARA